MSCFIAERYLLHKISEVLLKNCCKSRTKGACKAHAALGTVVEDHCFKEELEIVFYKKNMISLFYTR